MAILHKDGVEENTHPLNLAHGISEEDIVRY